MGVMWRGYVNIVLCIMGMDAVSDQNIFPTQYSKTKTCVWSPNGGNG